MNYFIYTSHHFTPHGRHELNKLTSLPTCGFIAQLVEHRTGISQRSHVRIPLKPWFFFRLLLSNCVNWKIYCDDRSSLRSTTAVQIYELLPGPSRRLEPVIKCSHFCRFFNVTLWGIYRWLEISLAHYFWECSLARWNFIRHFEKHEAWRTVNRNMYSGFWGNDTFPSLYDAQVYERKFKSEYLETILRAIT